MKQRHFMLGLLFIVIITGMFCFCSNNYINKKYSTTYAIISTPDGNTIAGYADDVTFHSGYTTVTIVIENSVYTTSLNNILIIENK